MAGVLPDPHDEDVRLIEAAAEPAVGPYRQQPLWSGILDSSAWWQTLDFLRPNELLPGDVLVTKNYKMSAAAAGTVRGQAVASWMIKSSMYSTHAMMCTGSQPVPADVDPLGGGVMIAHSSSGNQWQSFDGASTYTKKPNIVFRPNNAELGRRAAEHAIMLSGYDPANGQSRQTIVQPSEEEVAAHEETVGRLAQEGRVAEIPAAPAPKQEGFVAGGYDAGARWKSVFKLKYKGRKAKNWIQAVRDRDLGEMRPVDTAVFGTDMFCSGFVAVCYELEGDILNVDPRALSVKALESVLNRSNAFKLIGRTWKHDPTVDPLI